MKLSYKRSIRIGELIQLTISKIIKDMKSLNLFFVTINYVKLSNDLLNCKIYYSIFGSVEEKEKVNKILKKNIKKIRYQISLRLNLRRTPVIFFIYDNVNESATKVFDILKQIENEKK
ncbi:MAG: 30S ribosome-binding factor RbfA [Endomicrobium sp.]|jgi:ribosome-binding factor A|nr:30S ribosome-binding factor RbfA [Endomicrobium sp.]